MAEAQEGRTAPGAGSASRISIQPAGLDELRELRNEYRWELDCQVVHDSWHERGFTDLYRILFDGELAGYGAIGGAPGEPRTILKELWTIPERRRALPDMARALIAAGGARSIEAQTNDPLLYPLLARLTRDVTGDTLLFADGGRTTLSPPDDALFRPLTEAERGTAFPHTVEPVGTHGLFVGDRLVATGGWFTHYNPPYGDLYMEVEPTFRRRGLASYLLQELKRVLRVEGYVPSARCRESNTASRRALEKAGMVVCGRIVQGRLED